MKVVVLTSAPSISGMAAGTLRDELGLISDSDVVTVVGSHVPPQPLPEVTGTTEAVAPEPPAPAAPAHPSNSTLARLRGHAKVRKVAKALRAGATSLRFAAVASRAGEVQSIVAAADVVVALDTQSHRAAWLLARRHHGPDVVVGAAAGKRVIAARRSRA